MSTLLGIVVELLLHGLFILFGGVIFGTAGENVAKAYEVELVSDVDAGPAKEDENEEKSAETKVEEPEELEAEEEPAPDSTEILRNLELSAAAAAPALDAASLSAIEQALSGAAAAAGDFADAVSFTSGGRIGGMAKPGAVDEKLENAFTMAEIDQKPRAVYQAQPMFPAEMRGKKVEGVVSLIFVVDATGKVQSPKVEKSSHPAFEKPALDAIRQWKFEPGLKGGQRVECKMRVPMRFQPSGGTL
jgi:TonB family protein